MRQRGSSISRGAFRDYAFAAALSTRRKAAAARTVQCGAGFAPATGHGIARAMRVFGFAGWSGSGKTTLIERIIPRLVERGLVVSLVKHAHHTAEIDQPGKDSYRHRQAGCREVMVSSGTRWALMHELRGASELTLPEALDRLSPCDLALVEGYKAYPIPKLEIWRDALRKPLLCLMDPQILAIATDSADALPAGTVDRLPVFGLSDFDAVATFVAQRATAGPLRN